MIFTLTGNLLAERTFTFAAWEPGRTQRATAESFQVGGKGINVSKMLQRLGVPTLALAFAGGAAGDECRTWLAGQAFATHLFPTTAATRSGLVVRHKEGSTRETTFLGPDRAADAGALAACAAHLEQQAAGQVLALCGSFPGWDMAEAAPLRAALAHWATRGVLVIDAYGPPLAWALTQPAALIKINRDELVALGATAATSGDATHGADDPVPIALAKLLRSAAPAAWVVSDGGGPLHFATREGLAGVLRPPPVQEVSATGSGDVLLAGLLAARWTRGLALPDALREALPLAAANAAHPGVAEFPLEHAASLEV